MQSIIGVLRFFAERMRAHSLAFRGITNTHGSSDLAWREIGCTKRHSAAYLISPAAVSRHAAKSVIEPRSFPTAATREETAGGKDPGNDKGEKRCVCSKCVALYRAVRSRGKADLPPTGGTNERHAFIETSHSSQLSGRARMVDLIPPRIASGYLQEVSASLSVAADAE